MRTRSQSKKPRSADDEDAGKHLEAAENIENSGTLSNKSRDGVGKLLNRVRKGFDKEDVAYLRHFQATVEPEGGPEESNEPSVDNTRGKDRTLPDFSKGDAVPCASLEVKTQTDNCMDSKLEMDWDDADWEDGFIPTTSLPLDSQEESVCGVLVDFDVSPGSAKRKGGRRATAAEKDVAEIVHKTHLLCLLGRGRLVDSACSDSLIQASIISILPKHLLKIAETQKLTASHLLPLVNWFHNNFSVSNSSVSEKPCRLALASTLETREGTSEMVAALSVALFRALNLTTRFVSVLDVMSLKPDVEKSEYTIDVSNSRRDIFKSSTLMVAGSSLPVLPVKSSSVSKESNITPLSTVTSKTLRSRKHGSQSQESQITDKMKDKVLDEPFYDVSNDVSELCNVRSEGLKRKGDLEFQMQLEMALAATAVGSSKNSMTSDILESTSSAVTTPFQRLKKIRIDESETSSNGMSTAIGSKKVGAPLYWAEVFCSGDNLTGKWVHIDAVNAIVDGESNVEAAVAACKKSLRYVVAFAGNGAKDVTRRYCTKWYKIASQRIDSTWWHSVLARLKVLEMKATCGAAGFEQKTSSNEKIEPSLVNLNCGDDVHSSKLCEASEAYVDKKSQHSSMSSNADRSILEDMELETRALTEPLPTNQLAYKNHHLYAIEKWIKRYQIIYPKGPILGYCSGHAVYPRTCVQILHSKHMWLREGLQVKPNELPSKVLKQSTKYHREEPEETDGYGHAENEKTVDLYGKWQTEPLCLPRAVNGIVPKNERGQVDVWSEKCLPPGTIHLRFPRIALVAKRLGIDFAPAMVGFESRHDRSFPVFEGIVACEEFKETLLEAYAEEEGRRVAAEKRRNEVRALSRWYQLLSSIVTRKRLNDSYGNTANCSSIAVPESDRKLADGAKESALHHEVKPAEKQYIPPFENHEHVFILVEHGKDGSSRMKQCHCGFSVQVEEL